MLSRPISVCGPAAEWTDTHSTPQKCSGRYNTKIDTNIQTWADIPPHTLIEQTKQSQRHQKPLSLPHGSHPSSFPNEICPLLEPRLRTGSEGLQPGQKGGSLAPRPQAVPSAMSAISSPPFLPSSSLRLLPRRPPPHPRPSAGRGAQKGGSGKEEDLAAC